MVMSAESHPSIGPSEPHAPVVVVHASHTESAHAVPTVPSSESWHHSDAGAEPVGIDSAVVAVRADDSVVGTIVWCAIYMIIKKEYIRPCISCPFRFTQSI